MIYVITFDPIKILTCRAFQNDCQNLSFVKAINVVAKNTCKMAISYLCHFCFETEFTISFANCIRNRSHIQAKEIGDEEPYYSTKILILSFIWAGLAALHKASTIY